MVDKDAVAKLFRSWFDTDSVQFEVNDDGTISGEGCIQNAAKFPEGQLPVRFKNFKGSLFFTHAGLHTLEGAPEFLDGDLRVRHNLLENLHGAPKIITGILSLLSNPLTSLVGFPNSVGRVVLDDDPQLPMLRLLNAKEIKLSGSRGIEHILNAYAGEGKRGVIRCQKDLIKAGFEGNAQW
jgi:hypothetical protein